MTPVGEGRVTRDFNFGSGLQGRKWLEFFHILKYKFGPKFGPTNLGLLKKRKKFGPCFILPSQKGERCAKECNAGTTFSGALVNLVPTICAGLAYFALGLIQ